MTPPDATPPLKNPCLGPAGILRHLATWAQENPQAPLVPNIREVAPGQYQIGLVHLDQKAQCLTFPGALNLNQGLMEYLIVTQEGSTHESLLVTDARPTDVQFAMLLLGAKGSASSERTGMDAPRHRSTRSTLKTAPRLKGDGVAIRVTWKTGNGEKTAPAEDWLINERTKKTVERGPGFTMARCSTTAISWRNRRSDCRSRHQPRGSD